MKISNSKTKAFAFLGAAFVLLIALLFTACPNSAGGNGGGSGGGGTSAYDVYVSVISNNKAYVYKNGSPTALSAQNPANDLNCSAVKALGTQVYIAGDELKNGAAKPCVWKADGSPYWRGTNRWSSAYDIALHSRLNACRHR